MPEKSRWTIVYSDMLKSDKKLKNSDVMALKEWLGKQPHLPTLSDEQLAVFVAACAYSIEAAKTAIDINYTLRTRFPRIWGERDIDSANCDLVMKYLRFGMMPAKEGRPVVLIYGIRQMESSLFDMEILLKGAYMIQDVGILQLGPRPDGFFYIFDMNNVTIGHLIRLSLTVAAASLKYMQEGSFCTIKGMHFMNGGPVLEKLLAMLKPFFNKQTWDMIRVHEKTDGLQECLDSKEIPKDYGGDGASIDEITERSIGLMKEYKSWFEEEDKLRVKEDRRPAGNKLGDGLQGSFRKLELD